MKKNSHGQPPLGSTTKELRVLIVDDMAENAKLIATRLSHKGFLPTPVTRGADAIALHKAKPFDLILMDLFMPDMDGIATTQAIRDQAIGHGPPIIGLSACVGPEEETACLSAGMTCLLEKPIDFPRLFDTMEALLAPRGQTQEPTQQRSNTFSLDSISGIAKVRALKLWKDPQQLLTSLGLFARRASKIHDELTLALSEENYPRLKEIAHAITGASGNLCLPAVHALCLDLSAQIDAREKRFIGPLIGTLGQHLSKLQQELPQPPKAQKRATTESLSAWLSKAFDALSEDNPDAMESLMEGAPITAAQKDQLQDHLLRFEFNAARQLLSRINAPKGDPSP